MAKFPPARGTRNRKAAAPGAESAAPAAALRGAVDVKALTKKVRYIVDEAGRRKSAVVDYEAWQNLLRQLGAAEAAGNAGPSAGDPGYALRRERGAADHYRPQQANSKEAADFRLETNVTRRNG